MVQSLEYYFYEWDFIMSCKSNEAELLKALQIVIPYVVDIATNDNNDTDAKACVNVLASLLDIEIQSATDTLQANMKRMKNCTKQ